MIFKPASASASVFYFLRGIYREKLWNFFVKLKFSPKRTFRLLI
ncbi:hypothetical protein HanRHA438_Chr15g0712341 [Helianthus annuus]|uniref:Uncharacterized protein n=1 Tax=Helianthus annuus TaxID=4232 RepID=A0A9K3H546_HELAN|nr:hypothetical protein HanXRQr2_Chr15g0700121 [Helianthus annuus]KAJ0451703.1 hypothetical protein HanHA300_Chr15g0570581 [Helianthus annuus]KAJ0456345.1 hypothetical protein HanIR_Chr15g0761361 [Helianthus annuus]KAJ0473588.1 hypothetical protein HanHA89_Chr15g0620041 [Helianthus annuus]KAJ0649166.1 hypothetical protein HanLR1_Chr15g0581151 [Helianthus annuus]